MKNSARIKHAKSVREPNVTRCGAPIADPSREASFNWAFVSCGACLALKRPDHAPTRFYNKVNKDGPLIIETKCWIWIGSRQQQGYGHFWVNGRPIKAHRWPYEYKHGPQPPEFEFRHLCDNTSCVNPDHLVPGTHSENMQDMLKKDRKRGIKLRVAEVREIRKRLAAGESREALAAEYGVHESSIYCIEAGRTWRGV